MEAEAMPNYIEAEEGEILNDDPDELYTPLERPHISTSNSCTARDIHSSDDDNQGKDSSSDSDSSFKNFRCAKIRKKSSSGVKPSNMKKKNYNIWCSDVQAEVLTSSLVDCNVDQENDRERDVESYNYRLGLSDHGNKFKNKTANTKDSGKKQPFGKRKHNGICIEKKIVNDVKDKKSDQSVVRNILSLSTTAESLDTELAMDIANKLCEEKEDLILRATQILGKETVISLFEETREIEASGGMLTMNGCRRRTPGGVFFYLLKTSEEIPREKINLVLSEDKKSRAEEKKLAAKQKRQLKAEKLKKTLSKDDFPTLLSRTELAIKEFKAKKLEEDSAGFKNPPPSPATDARDCSSDGEERKESEAEGRKGTQERAITSYDDSLFGNEEDNMDVF